MTIKKPPVSWRAFDALGYGFQLTVREPRPSQVHAHSTPKAGLRSNDGCNVVIFINFDCLLPDTARPIR